MCVCVCAYVCTCMHICINVCVCLRSRFLLRMRGHISRQPPLHPHHTPICALGWAVVGWQGKLRGGGWTSIPTGSMPLHRHRGQEDMPMEMAHPTVGSLSPFREELLLPLLPVSVLHKDAEYVEKPLLCLCHIREMIPKISKLTGNYFLFS